MSTQDLTLAMTFTATDKGLEGKLNLTEKQLSDLNKAQYDNARASDKSTTSNQRFEKSLFALKAGAAAVVTGLAAVSLKTIAVTRETERMTAQLKTMTGSSEAAGLAFERLNSFAKQTPFTLQQSIDSFVKLKALGLDPSERAMKSYGNTASAMGKDMQQMIEAVADAATGEFERLKEFGIKSRQEGENVTFTFRGIETTIKKSSENIQEYLLNIGETHFGDAMANQMDTIDGKFSNLEQTVDDFFRVLGDDNAAMDAFRAAIDWVTEAIDNATVSLKFFKANLKADAIAENANAIADAVHNIEAANLRLSEMQNKIGRTYHAQVKRLKENVNELSELAKVYTKLHPLLTKSTVQTNANTKANKNNSKSLKKIKEVYEEMIGPMSVWTALHKEVDSLTDSVMTNQEKYNTSVEHYQHVLDSTGLSQETFNRLVTKAKNEFLAAEKSAHKHAKTVKEEIPQAYKNAATGIQSSFTDLFENIFNNGEDAFDDFAETLKNTFTKMLAEMATLAIARPIIIPMQTAIGGLFGVSPAANAGVSGQLGGSGSLSSLSSLTNLTGGNSIANMANSGLNSVQNFFGGGTKYGMVQGFNGPVSPGGNVFGGSNLGIGAAGLLGGLGANYLFDGKGYSGTLGGVGASVGYSLGAGAGAAALSGTSYAALGAVAGPIGAVVGMVLGGALGSLFGDDSDATPDLNFSTRSGSGSNSGAYTTSTEGNEYYGGYQGQFGSYYLSTQHDAFSSTAEAEEFAQSLSSRYSALEGIISTAFGDTVSKSIAKAVKNQSWADVKFEEGDEFSGGIENAFRAIFSNVMDGVAKTVSNDYRKIYHRFLNRFDSVELGLGSVAALKDLDSTSTRSTKGKSDALLFFTKQVQGVEAKFESLAYSVELLKLDDLNDDFHQFVDEVLNLGRSERMTSQRALELATVLDTVNATLDTLKISTYDYTILNSKLAESLAQNAGGIESLLNKTAFYYNNFYSENERLQDVFNNTSSAIADFNKEFDQTISDKTSLRTLIDSVDLTTDAGIKLYNSALNLAPAIVDNLNAYDQLSAAATSELNRAREEEISLLQKSIDVWSDLKLGLTEFVQSLKLSDLSILRPLDKLSEAKSQYTDIYNNAKTGDVDALQNYAKYAQQYLEIGRSAYSSSSTYSDIYNRVINDAGTIDADLNNRINDSQQQLNVHVDNSSVVESINQLIQVLVQVQSESSGDITAAIERTTDAVMQIASNPVSTL